MEGLKAYSPGRELCCADGETGHRACTKKAILVLWMQFSFLRFKLKEEPLIHTGITAQCWKVVSSKMLSPSTATDMHFLSSCWCFSCGLWRWYKEKLRFWTSHEIHVFVATQIRLHSCYWVSESLYNWLSILAIVILPNPKKSQWMHQLYIFSNFRDIYLITENNCSKEVQIAKIWERMPLNISFMTKLGLKVGINLMPVSLLW